MKKGLWIAVLVLCLALCGSAAAGTVASGTCGANGNNVAWTLNDSGEMTIYGSGAMYNYSSVRPWSDYVGSIKTVVIESGVTSLTPYAFLDCANLESVSLPGSLKNIGHSAFLNCTKLSNVVIPGGVTVIGQAVFQNCESLTSVTIPDTVTEIGRFAFDGCLSLPGISIPENVTQIGDYAFEYCESIKSIALPSNITRIGEFTFEGCKNLESLIIPGSVTEIGGCAFEYCSSLASLTVPASVTSIGVNAFRYDADLKDIYYQDTKNAWDSISIDESNAGRIQKLRVHTTDEVTITFDPGYAGSLAAGIMDPVYLYPGEEWTVPGCGYTYDSANTGDFDHWVTSTVLYYPGETITVTEDMTLKAVWTRYRSAITLRDLDCATETPYQPRTEFVYNGDPYFFHDTDRQEGYTFIGWGNMGRIFRPGESLTVYNAYTFGTVWIKNLSDTLQWNVTDGILRISGNGVIDGCMGGSLDGNCCIFLPWYERREEITSIVIGEGITGVGTNAFTGLTAVTEISLPSTMLPDQTPVSALPGTVTVADGNPYMASRQGLVWEKDGMRLIAARTQGDHLDIFEGIRSVAGGAVKTPYAEVSLPLSLIEIESGSFTGKVNTVNYAGTQEQWNQIAIGKTMLDYATIITSDGEIDPKCGDSVHYHYNNGTIRIYGTGSMWDFKYINPFRSLTIDAVEIEQGVTNVGGYAFADHRELRQISLPEGLVSIDECAFENCTSLGTVALPESLRTIGDAAFYYCSSLNAVSLPDGLQTIGEEAFYRIEFFTVTIPWNVVSIGDNAFEEYGLSLSVYEESEGLNYAAANNLPYTLLEIPTAASGTCGPDLTWTLDGRGVLTISGTGEMADYNWESSANPVSLTCPWDSFRDSIVSVVIDNGVTGIGEYAFCMCRSLTAVTIPEGITEIGSSAFSYCDKLTGVLLPDSITGIGDFAFYGCGSLTDISLPYGLTEIGESVFQNCEGLTGATLPETVTSIGKDAFSNTGLINIDLPDSVNAIGSWAFYSCRSLTGIIIPDGVSEIEYSVFRSCDGLTAVTIPNTVTSIGESAFQSCTGLTDVYYSGTAAEWSRISIGNFNECLSGAVIHYLGETEPDLRNDNPTVSFYAGLPEQTDQAWSFNAVTRVSVGNYREMADKYGGEPAFTVNRTDGDPIHFTWTVEGNEEKYIDIRLDNIPGSAMTAELTITCEWGNQTASTVTTVYIKKLDVVPAGTDTAAEYTYQVGDTFTIAPQIQPAGCVIPGYEWELMLDDGVLEAFAAEDESLRTSASRTYTITEPGIYNALVALNADTVIAGRFVTFRVKDEHGSLPEQELLNSGMEWTWYLGLPERHTIEYGSFNMYSIGQLWIPDEVRTVDGSTAVWSLEHISGPDNMELYFCEGDESNRWWYREVQAKAGASEGTSVYRMICEYDGVTYTGDLTVNTVMPGAVPSDIALSIADYDAETHSVGTWRPVTDKTLDIRTGKLYAVKAAFSGNAPAGKDYSLYLGLGEGAEEIGSFNDTERIIAGREPGIYRTDVEMFVHGTNMQCHSEIRLRVAEENGSLPVPGLKLRNNKPEVSYYLGIPENGDEVWSFNYLTSVFVENYEALAAEYGGQPVFNVWQTGGEEIKFYWNEEDWGEGVHADIRLDDKPDHAMTAELTITCEWGGQTASTVTTVTMKELDVLPAGTDLKEVYFCKVGDRITMAPQIKPAGCVIPGYAWEYACNGGEFEAFSVEDESAATAVSRTYTITKAGTYTALVALSADTVTAGRFVTFRITGEDGTMPASEYHAEHVFRLPAGISVIGEEAFAGNTSVTAVDIPAGVTFIHEDAFKGSSVEAIYTHNSEYLIDYAVRHGMIALTE